MVSKTATYFNDRLAAKRSVFDPRLGQGFSSRHDLWRTPHVVQREWEIKRPASEFKIQLILLVNKFCTQNAELRVESFEPHIMLTSVRNVFRYPGKLRE